MYGSSLPTKIEAVPFIPVRAFKNFELKSIPSEDVFKVLHSSGTTGASSKIFLDRKTARAQSKKLIEIFGDAFGTNRFPMLIIDTESTVKDRDHFSARTAAINGFSFFSKNREFALNDDLSINYERVAKFLEENRKKKIFVFGFTFLIWQCLVQQVTAHSFDLDLSNAFILHGGGWKKMDKEKISNEKLKLDIKHSVNCSEVRNYYGMVEQTGTIFMECRYGNLHAPTGGGVITRDPVSLQPALPGDVGLIQIFSTIQESYPGHSVLTEDLGIVMNKATCPCGKKNSTLKFVGRLKKAEIRGCSDTDIRL